MSPITASYYGGSRDYPVVADSKVQIFLTLLSKQYGVASTCCWTVADGIGQPGMQISVADIVVDARSFVRTRSHKKQMKSAAKGGRKYEDPHNVSVR